MNYIEPTGTLTIRIAAVAYMGDNTCIKLVPVQRLRHLTREEAQAKASDHAKRANKENACAEYVYEYVNDSEQFHPAV